MFSRFSKVAARSLIFLGLIAFTRGIPYALHQLVVVDTAGDALIRLNGYDAVVPGNKVSREIIHLSF